MHRALPDRPSLEYLKEAKDLVRTLQQQRPVARLAGRQVAVWSLFGFGVPRMRLANHSVCADTRSDARAHQLPFTSADLTDRTLHSSASARV